jgi:hypothetical protein
VTGIAPTMRVTRGGAVLFAFGADIASRQASESLLPLTTFLALV